MDNHTVTVYRHPNPEIRSFLTTIDLSAPRVEYFKSPLTQEDDASLRPLGLIGAQMVRDILAVEGVLELRIKPKEIRVKKELSSSWEQIETQILEVVQRAIKKKKFKVIK